MEAPEETTPRPPKKIRLTRAEAYAMQLVRPRQKRLTFVLVGLLMVVALGAILWHFQDLWLPYWFPEEPAAAPSDGPAVAPAAEDAIPGQPAKFATESPAPVALGPELDFLSAAAWDHPQFQQGVRLFNQALDRQRAMRKNGDLAQRAQQIEQGALQAAVAFDGIRAEAPAAVPLAEYIARCQQLVQEVRRARASAAAPAPAPQPAPAPIPTLTAEELPEHPDWVAGAKLFNQAVEQFKQYQADTSRKELLKPTEELARQASRKFEELKRQAPEELHREIDRQIHQSFGIVSACRGELLKNGQLAPAKTR